MAKVKRLLRFVRPYSLPFIASLILMAVVGACEALRAFLMGPIFNQVLRPANDAGRTLLFDLPISHRPVYLQEFFPERIHNVWTIVALAFIIVTIVRGLSEFLATYLINLVGQSAVRDLRNQLYTRMVQQSLNFFTENPTGRLMSAVSNDTDKIQDAASNVLSNLLKQTFTLVSMLAVMFYVDWRLSLFSMLLIPLVVYPSANIGRAIRASSASSQDKMAEINRLAHETFAGIRIVKAFVMEHLEIARFKAATERLLKSNMRWVRAQAATAPLMEILAAVTIAGLLLYERNKIAHDTQTIGMFVAFIYALFKASEAVKRLTGVNNSLQLAIGASDQVFRFLNVTPELTDRTGATPAPTFSRDIVFDGVDFEYERGVPLLRNVNLQIRKGEIVAIVGSSGAGKTTLASLIPRFFDVTHGRILMDGRDLRDITLSSLRSQIGMVTQETVLFNDTVYNNICYGSGSRHRSEVVAAAHAALAHDFIEQMPGGYQAAIGERGQRLSGGQRQRIAIARALLKNPPLLILDEATSELDSESEMLVQKALNNLMVGRTVLVIAHRLSTVRRADRIIVLDRGTISEVGTHADLVSQGGIYQRLHDLQFVDAEP